MAKELTRKELYNLVWKKPVMEIAKEYGLSDRGLGKLCERLGIPTPPRGYWAKLKSGQKIKKPPLLFSTSYGDGQKIVIQKVKAALNNSEITSEKVLSKEIQEVIEYEKDPLNKIKVPAKVTDFHKVILKDEYERQRWDKKPLSSLDKRRNKILTCLLNVLEEKGYMVFYLDNIYRIKIQNSMEYVYIGINNYINRYKRDLTEKELAENPGTRKWTYVDEPTKKLVIRIYNDYGRIIKNLVETDKLRLEDMLNDAVIEITKEILNQRSYRIKRDNEAHESFLKEERKRKELQRKQDLLQEINNWKNAKDIRAFVKANIIAIEAGKITKEDFDDWKEWALAYADEIDPLTESNTI